MEKCLLLAAKPYDFDDNGKRVQGVSLTYLTGEVENSGTLRGCEPLKISAPVEIAPQLQAVPGVYELDFKQRPGKNGRPTLQVVGVRFLEDANGFLQQLRK